MLAVARSEDRWVAPALALIAGLAVVILLPLGPLALLAVTMPLAAAVWAVAARRRVPSLTLRLLAVLLAGYVFLGRGFAYIGVGPVYIGEVVLVASVVAACICGGLPHMVRSRVAQIYVVFAALGTVLTVQGFGIHGIDAIRDAAVWYYGVFMLVGAWLFSRREHLERSIRWLAGMGPWFLLWVPPAYVVYYGLEAALPRVPGSDTPILVFKGGDMAVMLALVIVFVVVCRRASGPFVQRWPTWLLMALAATDFVVIATKNRGGLLAITAAVLLAIILMPNLRIVQAGAIAAAMVAMFALSSVSIELSDREISVAQLQENAQTILQRSSGGKVDGDGTATWRIEFWQEIVDDTLRGRHFWQGNGFGVNLADRFGYQATADGSLRSPHNVTMTILARMGVPGLVLWTVLMVAYVSAMASSFVRARRAKDHFWMSMFVLLLAHWTASMVNASFDPYLEGPQGAIVFWTGMGIGLAARQVYRDERRPAIGTISRGARLAPS